MADRRRSQARASRGLLATCAGVAIGSLAWSRLAPTPAEAGRPSPFVAPAWTPVPTDALDRVVTLLVLLAGLAVATWYVVSAAAVLVCVAAAGLGHRWRGGEVALQRWGAPVLRRAGTAAVGLVLSTGVGVATAGAAGAPPHASIPDDLGWLPTTGQAAADPAPDQRRPSAPDDVRHGDRDGAHVEAAAGAVTVTAAAPYTVRPGDSLWSIASRSLQERGSAASVPAVAAEWPRWYAANRDVVGPDPDLIHPGQELLAPPQGDHP